MQERSARSPTLVLGALGVVYGDIGTSPIYAFREALRATIDGRQPQPSEVIGLLSLIIWSLILIVTFKYVCIVLKADNHGEGGSLSLLTLTGSHTRVISIIGMTGACLFLGDAVITPAISVLSAVEGLEIAAPSLHTAVVPITVAILVTLFAVQRFGTGRVAVVFGPLTLLWFLVIAGTGFYHLLAEPTVLLSFNPLEAGRFLAQHSAIALTIAGAVFLAVTGAEALYADLGHFGRSPITIAWFGLVFPCLILSYLGQGAFVLENGFNGQPILFGMVPAWASMGLVVLATIATVIASQAVISGAFSLVSQAVQLNFLPRMNIRHTSEHQSGQIFIPRVNLMLMLGVIALVVLFRNSERLSAAYGIAVTGDMLMTTVMLGVVLWRVWHRPGWQVLLLVALFSLIEISFLAANSIKLLDGGWVSILIAGSVFTVMFTWVSGDQLLKRKTRRDRVSLLDVIASIEQHPPTSIPGQAIYLNANPDIAPLALLHSLKHFKVLHEQIIVLHVQTIPQPHIPDSERITIDRLNEQFCRMTMNFGFMEIPNVSRALKSYRRQGFEFDFMATTFILSRRSLQRTSKSGLPRWQERLYIALSRNAADATEYFHIPTNRVVELGAQMRI